MHGVEYVLDLCELLIKTYPVDTLAFWDDTMGTKRDRLMKICEGMLKRGISKKIKWYAALRADQVDLELLRTMKQANCFNVAFGIESGSDRVLKLLRKGISVEQNRAACAQVKEAGLALGVSIIVGTPGETLDDVRQTLDFCRGIDCDSIGCGRFRPLPGSPSYKELKAQGLINPSDVDWRTLGNFSLDEGPCYADMSAKAFRAVMKEVRDECWHMNRKKFIQNNTASHPEIVELYYGRKRPPPSGYLRVVKECVRLVTPPIVADGIWRLRKVLRP